MSDFVEGMNNEDQEVPDEVAAMFDLKQKKKKKKKKVEVVEELVAVVDAGGDATSMAGGLEAVGGSVLGIYELDPPKYTYSQLLNRVVDFIHQNNPELTDKKRFTMKPPQLMRGTFSW